MASTDPQFIIHLNGSSAVRTITSGNVNADTYTLTLNGTSCFPNDYQLDIGDGVYRGLDVCAGGHRVDGEFVEYIDGILVASCDLCGSRIVFNQAPGGSNAKKIEGLLLELSQTDEFSEEQLELLADLASQIQEEAEALDRSLQLLVLAQEVVRTRL